MTLVKEIAHNGHDQSAISVVQFHRLLLASCQWQASPVFVVILGQSKGFSAPTEPRGPDSSLRGSSRHHLMLSVTPKPLALIRQPLRRLTAKQEQSYEIQD